MVKAQKFVYVKEFEGEPNSSNFQLVEEELPALKNGEFLAKAEYLSVDPYMRPYMARYPLGATMIGGQVAKVLETKNPKFPVDSYVVGYFGWRTHTICNPEEGKDANVYALPKLVGSFGWKTHTICDPEEGNAANVYALPKLGPLPVSLGLGYLGMPGNTAYFGFLEICQPKAGETVVVTGAAGAVGSCVGQIAKLKGCRVIGFVGSDEKCDWIKNELGFDVAINYKNGDMKKALKDAAVDGVDCYFDNVGGELSSIIINQMKLYGRISVCGFISSYNSTYADWPKVPHVQPDFVFKQLKMEGFVVDRWLDRWMEGILQNLQWISEKKMVYRETVTDGFENMPQAFIDMLRGKNVGKAVVKA